MNTTDNLKSSPLQKKIAIIESIGIFTEEEREEIIKILQEKNPEDHKQEAIEILEEVPELESENYKIDTNLSTEEKIQN